MMRVFRAGLALGSGLFATVCASAALAGSVTFDLTGDGLTNTTGTQQLFYYDGGYRSVRYAEHWVQSLADAASNVIQLTITAGAFTQVPTVTAAGYGVTEAIANTYRIAAAQLDANAHLIQSGMGLGVMNNGTARTDDAFYLADGTANTASGQGWIEFLTLDFDRDVVVDFAEFSAFDSSDRYRLMFDADGDGTLGTAGDLISEAFGTGPSPIDGVAGFQTGGFGIMAGNASSGWALQQVGVSVPTPTPALAPVPLPAAGWLLVAGLAGLWTVGRRRLRG